MYYKFTHKKGGDEFAKTYYGGTKRNSEVLRKLIAEKINVSPEALWLSTRNIPYKIRKKLVDGDDSEFILTVLDEVEPKEVRPLKERQIESYGVSQSELKSINFKIKNLFYPTQEFSDAFPKYQDWTKLYHDIRNQVLRSEQLKDKEYVNGFTYLEFVDSFITNFSEGTNDVRLEIKK